MQELQICCRKTTVYIRYIHVYSCIYHISGRVGAEHSRTNAVLKPEGSDNMLQKKHFIWIGLGTIIVILLIMLLVVNAARLNTHAELKKSRNAIGEALYNQLFMMCQTFDQINIPDQEASAVGIMKNYFLAAKALNEALADGFGERYRILSPEMTNDLEAIFTRYETAFRAGLATNGERDLLAEKVDQLRSVLESRYSEERILPE